MIRACLCLLAGTYALQLSSFTIPSAVMSVAAFACVVMLPFRRLRSLALFAAGLALFHFHALQVVDARIEPRFAGDSLLTTISVIDFPRATSRSVSFLGEPVDDSRVPARVRVSWYNPPVAPRLGDVWQLELRLKSPRGNSNPGVFDYESWLFRERIGAVGYVVNGKRNRLLQTRTSGAVDRYRQAFVDRLQQVLPDGRAASVIAAISVGARHLVTPEQWARYAKSGTSHLMAISGLHVGLAAAVTYVCTLFSLGLFRYGGNNRDVAVCAALLTAAGYALISGLAVPALRATLMLAMIAAVLLRRRYPRPLLILCAACLVIVILDPLATMAPGFKLSFAAVMLLLWLANRLTPLAAVPGLRRPASALRSLWTMQLILLLGLLPLTVLMFHRIAVVAPLMNLLAVPLFSFLTVPLVLIGVVLVGPLQPLGDGALHAAAASIELLEWLVGKSLLLPYADMTTATIEQGAWLYLLLPLMWVVAPPGWPGRYVAWLAALALTLYRPGGPGEGCADVAVLDVGQGLAVVVQTHEHVVVFDTGPSFFSGSNMGDRVVLPYLAGRGIRRIDKLIVSHADIDHAGGAPALLAALAVDEVLAGEPVASIGVETQACVSGMRWRWDGVLFRFLHPDVDAPGEGNDASCVLLIETGTHRLLVTGDIEASAERRLLSGHRLPSVDVVTVPHHGSRTSSSDSFVTALSPSVAIVSAGYNNRWGFPKDDVVARWRHAGADVLQTAVSGAIVIRVCKHAGIVSITQNREQRRRIWHAVATDDGKKAD